MAKDSRLTEIEQDREEQLNEIDQQYGEMISNSQQYYDQQIEASKQYAEQQQQIQQEKNDFELQQIQQQKDEAQQAHIKEQSGAYADWQKQSNRYGVNAEQMAAAGLSRTGFSESAQVSMYNAYQNRVATAQAALTKANTAYDNAMTNARLQNNALLAEIAAQAYREQAELALQAFQYENSLLMQQESEKRAWTGIFDTRYAQMLDQINTERALAEQQRQANLAHARWQQEQQAAKEQQQAILDALYGGNSGATGAGTVAGFTKSAEVAANAVNNKKSIVNNTKYQTYPWLQTAQDAGYYLRKYGMADKLRELETEESWKRNGSTYGSYPAYLAQKLEQFGIPLSSISPGGKAGGSAGYSYNIEQ